MDEKKDTATLTFRKQAFEVPAGMTVRDAILRCDLNPETVLAVRDGELITDDVRVQAGDRIKLVATISGGAAP